MKHSLYILIIVLLCFNCKNNKAEQEISEETKELSYVEQHYNKKEVEISMRDGIKLYTTIYSPKDTTKTYPILMMRTPYSSKPYGKDELKEKIGPNEHLMKEGNIFVYQDVHQNT